MKKTAFDKIVIGFVVLVMVIFSVLILVTIHITKSQLIKKTKSDLQGESSLIENQLVLPYMSGNISTTEFNTSANAIANDLQCYIWVSDNEGNITFCSNNYSKANELSQINDYISTEKLQTSFTDKNVFDKIFKEDMISICTPIYDGNTYVGSLLLHSSLSSMKDFNSSIFRSAYMPFMIIVVISLIALMLMTNSMLTPLREIISVSHSYAMGNFNARINVTSKNEFGELARSMEQMADELSRSNEHRKTFISNISHDFKSPLTSIKGYIEAMLDGTIPPDKYEKYLNIVLNETMRLTKLTQGLLELNNFDSFDLQLDKSNFDLKSVIQPTINTFEGRCQDKDIYLHAIYHTDNTTVYADRTKIQQVIYNLVDNAIKFTPEGRQITIQVTEKNDKIYTSVKDEGVGIPPEAQKKVFDRFYKTDPSRGKDKIGNGLGLSIIKEIIKAHGENITLTSKENEGSEFVFPLPKERELQVPIKPVHSPINDSEKDYFSNGKFKIKKN